MRHKYLNLQNVEIVAFDWDNTLVLSREALIFCINKVLNKYHLPDWCEVRNKRNENLSFRDNFPLIFGDKAAEAYEDYREIYKKNALPLLRKPDKADESLNMLRDNAISMMVVTNKDRVLLEFELPYLYHSEYFTKIVCGHEAPEDKPSARQLEFAVEGKVKEITVKNVWMVGDSPMDSRCAVAAGAKAIRIGQPIWQETVPQDKQVLFFRDFAAFYEYLTA